MLRKFHLLSDIIVSVDKAVDWDYYVDEELLYELLNKLENEINEGNFSGEQIASIVRGVSEIGNTTSERIQQVTRRIDGQIYRNRRDDSRSQGSSSLGIEAYIDPNVPQHFKSAEEVAEFFGPYYEGGGTDINDHYHVTQEEDRFLGGWMWMHSNEAEDAQAIEIANRIYARGRKQSPSDFPSSLSKTAEEGVVIDPNLKQNYAEWQKENPNGIVAYRVNYNSYNTPEEVQAGRIGNPFSESERGEVTVEKFYKWLVTGENFGNPKATEAFRQAIIDKILNTPVDSPILYYKDLGRQIGRAHV